MKFNITLLLCVAMLIFSSCEIINPSENIPAYLIIEKIDLTTEGGQGGNSHAITHAWVTVDGEELGAFPLPAKIPVLEEGLKPIEIYPVTKINDLDFVRDIYPFYNVYREDVEFVAAEDVEINPGVKYKENIVFEMIETFEGVNHLFSNDMDGDVATSFEGVTTDAFEGRSALATLNADHLELEAGSININRFPVASNDSYLELNYKSNVDVFVEFVGYDSSNEKVEQLASSIYRLNKASVWKKSYVDFSAAMQAAKGAINVASYRIVISAGLTADMLESLPEAKVYIDNVKMITFADL